MLILEPCRSAAPSGLGFGWTDLAWERKRRMWIESCGSRRCRDELDCSVPHQASPGGMLYTSPARSSCQWCSVPVRLWTPLGKRPRGSGPCGRSHMKSFRLVSAGVPALSACAGKEIPAVRACRRWRWSMCDTVHPPAPSAPWTLHSVAESRNAQKTIATQKDPDEYRTVPI